MKALNCKFNSISFIFNKKEKIIFTNIKSKDLSCEIQNSNGKTIVKGNLLKFDKESISKKFSEPKEFLSYLLKLGYFVAKDDDDDFPLIDTRTGKVLEDFSDAIDHLSRISTYEFEQKIEYYLRDLNSFFIQTNRLEITSSITGLKPHYEERKSRRVRNRF